MSDETPRERYRRQIRQEALSAALDQLTERGAAALSVNAVAKQLGLSGPALYRYFSGRDELLTELLVDAYAELADALEAAARLDGPVAARLRAVAGAYREWALTHPQRYLLIFGTPVPGYTAPAERTTPLARRALNVLMAVHAAEPPLRPLRTNAAADAACAAWAVGAGAPSSDGSLVRSAITFWTRLHGIVSLELDAHFTTALPEASLLYAAEVDELVAPWE